MPQYTFQHVPGGHAEDCPCHQADANGLIASIDLQYSMKEVPGLDAEIGCPTDGCGGKLRRVVSVSVGIIMKGGTAYDWKPNETMVSRINGRETRFQFIDHSNQKGAEYQTQFSKLAGKGVQGINNAYYSEKHGRMVVDVASDSKDPLGQITRAQNEQKARGEFSTTKVQVGQSTKVK